MRLVIASVLAMLGGCGSVETSRLDPGRLAVSADRSPPRSEAEASAGQVTEASDCEARNPPGLYLVRVGEHPRSSIFYAMAWTSRPPTPQAVSMACMLNPGKAGLQDTANDSAREDRRLRRAL